MASHASTKPLVIGIVAGEHSGDILGADLLNALKKNQPNLKIIGIPGPHMQAAGCQPLFEMDAIAVGGLIEVIRHLPRILYIRHQIIRYFLNNPPDIFIGIDAPDFNLSIEEKLKKAGITTVHYVSPSVWAWRQSRLKKIKRAVDLMLTLFPFEKTFYTQHNIPAEFIGHPFADSIALENDRTEARRMLGHTATEKIITLMPGSRAQEINYLGKVFLQAAQLCWQQYPDLIFLAPMVNAKRREQFIAIWQQVAPQLPLTVLDGQAQLAIVASDVVLLASGTATLETMLLKRPMIVAYRLAGLTYAILRHLVKVSRIALPNLLSHNPNLVPEFIQQNATPENLSKAVLEYLEHPELSQNMQQEFLRIHKILRCNASEQAAKVILALKNSIQI